MVLRVERENTAWANDEVVDVVRRGLRHDWSDEVARTHVAGVVGRMAELDLIRREWNGRRVRYELSDVKDLPEFSRFLGPELHDA